jgi:hypothetical protein
MLSMKSDGCEMRVSKQVIEQLRTAGVSAYRRLSNRPAVAVITQGPRPWFWLGRAMPITHGAHFGEASPRALLCSTISLGGASLVSWRYRTPATVLLALEHKSDRFQPTRFPPSFSCRLAWQILPAPAIVRWYLRPQTSERLSFRGATKKKYSLELKRGM